jgi:hypothetical protein
MCLQLFGHRCWQYNSDLSAFFPLGEMSMALEEYLSWIVARVVEPIWGNSVFGRLG